MPSFPYRTLKQAAVAALRVYGPMTACSTGGVASSLVRQRKATPAEIKWALECARHEGLIREMGELWTALPSRVGIGECV